MILESKLPEGFEFSETGQILYDGFDLQANSISLSQKYIAALKIGSMGLGEIQNDGFPN